MGSGKGQAASEACCAGQSHVETGGPGFAQVAYVSIAKLAFPPEAHRFLAVLRVEWVGEKLRRAMPKASVQDRVDDKMSVPGVLWPDSKESSAPRC